MGFLLKCFLCIAAVLIALQWRGGESGAPSAPPRTRAAAPQPPRRPQIEEAARGLAASGAEALMSAARDRCLSAPRECAAALQELQGATWGR